MYWGQVGNWLTQPDLSCATLGLPDALWLSHEAKLLIKLYHCMGKEKLQLN